MRIPGTLSLCIAAAILTPAITAPLRAQAAALAPLALVDKLFDSFTDFGVFMTAAKLTKAGDIQAQRAVHEKLPLRQVGIEFSWSLRTITKPICARKDSAGLWKADPTAGRPKTAADSITPEGCILVRDDKGAIPVRTCIAKPSGLTEVRVERDSAGGKPIRQTEVYKGETSCSPPKDSVKWNVEMGLAYVQSDPITARDPALKFSGMFKEFPRVSLYANSNVHEWLGPLHLGPYVGGSVGYTALEDLRIAGVFTDTLGVSRDTTLTAPTANYLEAGIVGGVVTDQLWDWNLPINIYLEAGYRFVGFPSIKWSSEQLLRPNSPRSVNLSNYSLTIGFQLNVKAPK